MFEVADEVVESTAGDAVSVPAPVPVEASGAGTGPGTGTASRLIATPRLLVPTGAGSVSASISIAIESVSGDGGETFEGMGLSSSRLAALARAGFVRPSPVQSALIPPALEGRDCLGNAPTGTGKTAAFLIPILEGLDDRVRQPQALVLAPTRELATQIGLEFERLAWGTPTRAVAVVGGESILRQREQLRRGCQLLIATPGRLIDLMERGWVRLDRVSTVVLDEADQMLDIGFRPAVERILETTPTPRRTMLLSATMPPEVRDLANRYMTEPVDARLIPEDDATIPAIRQAFLMVDPRHKTDVMGRLLRRESPRRAIVFCRTKHGADRLGGELREGGWPVGEMHGNLTQSRRNRVLGGFRAGKLSILVATDVVGRGIDVRGVSHVFNFDLPDDPANYIHRIGRTGRMGSDGTAFSLVTPDQGRLLDQIEKNIGRPLEADLLEGYDAPPRPSRPVPPRRHGHGHGHGHHGRRPSRGGGHGHGHGHGHHGGGGGRRRGPRFGPGSGSGSGR